MFDVIDKAPTHREAIASGKIFVGAEVFQAIESGGVARVAAIMASKWKRCMQ